MATPHVARSIETAHDWVRQAQLAGKRVGLVPTMGALHAGHFSLVEAARAECDLVAVTIFVNPTQFGPHEDLDRYPRTLEQDLAGLTQLGVELVFAPPTDAMYPAGATAMVEPPRVADDLEGRCRPGHFRGVTTIVLKLFQVVPADIAYFGEKDFQQCLVIRDMVRDLLLPMKLCFCPTIRESDGLALSSRNRYLSGVEREQALGLSRSLRTAQEMVAQGERDAAAIERELLRILASHRIHDVDYAAVRHPDTLQPLAQLEGPSVALIAARVGSTRLIDNRQLRLEGTG
jgi:pantoate--beta-alanine ligase